MKSFTRKRKIHGGDKRKRTQTRTRSPTPMRSPIPIQEMEAPFVSTEGEDNLEATLSFLIEMMGGSLYEAYVYNILNTNLKIPIKCISVQRPEHPKEEMKAGIPAIFFGSANGTHFTCTVDGKNLWNSYNNGIQQPSTDHFCQTFVLMYMVYTFLHPNTPYRNLFRELQKGMLVDNVMVAIKFACYIIESVMNKFPRVIDDYVQTALAPDNRGNPIHLVNRRRGILSPSILLTRVVLYCRGITKAQIEGSTFMTKIDLSHVVKKHKKHASTITL